MGDLEEVGDRCAELFWEEDVSLRCIDGWHVIILMAWYIRLEAIVAVCGCRGDVGYEGMENAINGQTENGFVGGRDVDV
jgi:hypothetical protein